MTFKPAELQWSLTREGNYHSPVATSHPPTLRERNYAQVRLDVLEASLALSAKRPFSELSVREISERAGISQGTFFNHFPNKDDVLFLFMGLWTVRAALRAQEVMRDEGSAREALLAIFELVATEMEQRPRLLLDVISVIALATSRPQVVLTAAERAMAFPGQDQSLASGTPTLEHLFTVCLEQAIVQRELPRLTSIPAATLFLRTTFYGIPIAARGARPSDVLRGYQEAFALLWKGLGGSDQPLKRSVRSRRIHRKAS